MGLAASAVSAIPALAAPPQPGAITTVGAHPAAGAHSPATTHRAAPATFDVRAVGATGDGKTVDSPAINKAIEAAAAAGGATVIFPAGNVHRADFVAVTAP